MNDEIMSLIKLQELDIELDVLQEEIESIPVRIEKLQSEIENLKSNLESVNNEIKQSQVKNKQLEGDLQVKDGEIKKHQSELNMVKTNDQYKALLSEIEECKEQKGKIEEDILVIMDIVEKGKSELVLKQKENSGKQNEIDALIKQLESKKYELEKKFSEEACKREEYTAKIPVKTMKKYEHVRSSRDGIAMASIENGACGTCYIKLTHQIISEVQKTMLQEKFSSPVYCENCSRILYLKTVADSVEKREVIQNETK